MLASAAALVVGIVGDDAGPIGLSLASAVAAIVLVWVGVARSSGSAQRDRDG